MKTNIVLFIFNHILVNIKNVFLDFEPWSTEKSYTVPLKEISVFSAFVNSFDMLPKQKLYQLMLFFTLNSKISVLFTYK